MFGSYNMDNGLTLGAGLNFNTGTPITQLGAIPFYGSTERVLTPRGSEGRLDSVTTFDIHADYALKLGGGSHAVQLGLDIFNLFNSQSVIATTENSQIDNRTYTPDPNPDFLGPTLFQQPRAVRFLVKYEF